MLQLSSGTLLSLGLWPGALHAAETAAENFHYVVINDLHYTDEACGQWMTKVLEQIKSGADKPDLILMVGDFTENGKETQMSEIKEVFQRSKIPFYGVIGNHDYLTQADRKAYESVFKDQLNYSFVHKGWQFIALDTTEGQKANNTKINSATLQWMDDNLKKLDKAKPTILFTHFPMGILTPSRPVNADDLLDKLLEFNLQAVYNGHFHGFTERRKGNAILTTNKCCSYRKANHDGTKEKGYFACKTTNGKIERTFVEVTIPSATSEPSKKV
ncbi:MAG: serine/threonine protein phosphatase [Verrucomicrobiales bacterium]|nr:serine/threonine protein phosphatase [Verrucomicrobiales bacterium]